MEKNNIIDVSFKSTEARLVELEGDMREVKRHIKKTTVRSWAIAIIPPLIIAILTFLLSNLSYITMYPKDKDIIEFFDKYSEVCEYLINNKTAHIEGKSLLSNYISDYNYIDTIIDSMKEMYSNDFEYEINFKFFKQYIDDEDEDVVILQGIDLFKIESDGERVRLYDNINLTNRRQRYIMNIDREEETIKIESYKK